MDINETKSKDTKSKDTKSKDTKSKDDVNQQITNLLKTCEDQKKHIEKLEEENIKNMDRMVDSLYQTNCDIDKMNLLHKNAIVRHIVFYILLLVIIYTIRRLDYGSETCLDGIDIFLVTISILAFTYSVYRENKLLKTKFFEQHKY